MGFPRPRGHVWYMDRVTSLGSSQGSLIACILVLSCDPDSSDYQTRGC